MSFSMTRKQAALLSFIEQYQEENPGVSPSFDEMKDAIGITSKSSVHRLVTALEERGKIVRPADRRARAIRIVQSDALRDIPTYSLIAELARRGETNSSRRANDARATPGDFA